MVKGYILKNLFSSEIVQRLHVSILFSRKCPGTLGSVLTLRLKMSYVRIPPPPRIFFFFFFGPVWRETFPSRHNLTPLTQGTQTRNPWREYKENRSGEREKRKKQNKTKHWTSSLWCAFFSFFFFYRMIGPVRWAAVGYGGYLRSIKRTNLSEDLYFFNLWTR